MTFHSVFDFLPFGFFYSDSLLTELSLLLLFIRWCHQFLFIDACLRSHGLSHYIRIRNVWRLFVFLDLRRIKFLLFCVAFSCPFLSRQTFQYFLWLTDGFFTSIIADLCVMSVFNYWLLRCAGYGKMRESRRSAHFSLFLNSRLLLVHLEQVNPTIILVGSLRLRRFGRRVFMLRAGALLYDNLAQLLLWAERRHDVLCSSGCRHWSPDPDGSEHLAGPIKAWADFPTIRFNGLITCRIVDRWANFVSLRLLRTLCSHRCAIISSPS